VILSRSYISIVKTEKRAISDEIFIAYRAVQLTYLLAVSTIVWSEFLEIMKRDGEKP
jgi:hypothetical protein